MAPDESMSEVVVSGSHPREKRPNFFMRIAIFTRQVFAELGKVATPTRKELIKFTAVVLGFVLVMMAIVYGLDLLFVWVAQQVFGVPRV